MAILKSKEADEMDDLYESENEGTPVKPPGEMEMEGEEPETIDQEESEGESAVVDNKILSPKGTPLKEGDRVILVVVKNFGDQSEVKYASQKESESPAASDMMEAESELDAMSKE